MPYEVRYSVESVAALRQFRQYDRSAILDQIVQVLQVNPTTESKARVKKLRQPAPTEYPMRVEEFRIFYDVEDGHVNVVLILSKEEAVEILGGWARGGSETGPPR